MQHKSVSLLQIQQIRGRERFSPCLMQFELSSMLCSARYSRGRLTERTRGELEEEREGEEEGGEGERKWDKERANALLDFQDVYLYCIIVLILKGFPWRMNFAQMYEMNIKTLFSSSLTITPQSFSQCEHIKAWNVATIRTCGKNKHRKTEWVKTGLIFFVCVKMCSEMSKNETRVWRGMHKWEKQH